ncbi:MAG: hypothetical protein U1F15_16120 [Burkholderiales bacterium]
MHSGSALETTFLFTDIEGSTRLWEEEPDRMRPALARHDLLCREAVEAKGGVVAGGERWQGFDAKREDAILAPLLAQARTALGDEAFTAAERAGLALSYADGMGEVRAWLSSTILEIGGAW